MKVLQLVDSIQYVRENCFQHQLARQLASDCDLQQVELNRILAGAKLPPHDKIVSCLKQRTLFRHAKTIGNYLDDQPVVVYDQDAWQAYMDDSPYKGAYDRILEDINVSTFALTTEWWVKFLQKRGLPSTFVHIWVLPEYCDVGDAYEDRPTEIGFIGSLHPRRKELVDRMAQLGVTVDVRKGGPLGYADFMLEMSNLGCFIHNEDMPIAVDGEQHNFGTGMWVKDIEAAARGCFSIRNRCEGSESYDIDRLPMIRLYDSQDEIPDILKGIREMDPLTRKVLLHDGVEFIKSHPGWSGTVAKLIA